MERGSRDKLSEGLSSFCPLFLAVHPSSSKLTEPRKAPVRAVRRCIEASSGKRVVEVARLGAVNSSLVWCRLADYYR